MAQVDQPDSQEEEPVEEGLNDDVVTQLTKAMDSRFSGFQGVLDKNIATLRNEFTSQLEEVRRSSLTPEELDDLKESEKEAELRRLKRENELLKLRKDYPDEVDFLSQFLEADSFENQLRLVSSLKKSSEQTEGPTPREEPEPDVSTNPVDLNNPKRKGDSSLAGILRNVQNMSREDAKKLLEAYNTPGALVRLRKGE